MNSDGARLTAPVARALLAAGLGALEARKQEINDLNVYPVPDGDTGTNLALTVRSLLAAAAKRLDANTAWAGSYDELKSLLERSALAYAYWDGTSEDEARIQDETGGTIRCLPFAVPDAAGRCLLTGRETRQVAVFAKAY